MRMRSPEEGSMPVTCLPGSHHRYSIGPVVLMNVNLLVAREWFGELLEKWSHAVRPSRAVTAPGPPMGSWSFETTVTHLIRCSSGLEVADRARYPSSVDPARGASTPARRATRPARILTSPPA